MSEQDNFGHPQNNQPLYLYHSPEEEIASGITHGIGTALSVVGLILLVVIAVNRGDIYHITSFFHLRVDSGAALSSIHAIPQLSKTGAAQSVSNR